MPVDSFKFLPRLIEMFYRMTDVPAPDMIPWTPLSKPVQDCKFGLITSAGLYDRTQDEPFDLERERQEPSWGDPSMRMLPSNLSQQEVGVSHLHLNTKPILEDFNIVLPLERFQTLQQSGEIGELARFHFSVMGFQGFPPDTTIWREETGPQIAQHFKSEEVDCILLTPA